MKTSSNLLWLSIVGMVIVLHCNSGTGLFGQEESNSTPIISSSELEDMQRQAIQSTEPEQLSEPSRGINFLTLLMQGGALMIPIAVMSLLVVAVAFERWFSLRRKRLLPNAIRKEIHRIHESNEALPVQRLYEVSKRHRSAAGRILEDMLRKAGRPVPEVEATIEAGCQREAERLYNNVRWLTLAASVTPLIGLLGTVWGMIIAFYNTTQLGVGENKADFLAEGIYVALVTTLGGLAVAIPAAIFAHYFEGKITKVMSLVETTLKLLVPKLELLEGGERYDINSQGLTNRPKSIAAAANLTP